MRTPIDFKRPAEPLESRLLPSVDVLTYHNDNARLGANLNETVLTPAAVNVATFRMKLCRFKECLESVDADIKPSTALDTGPGPVCAAGIAPPTKDRALRKSYSALLIALALATSGCAIHKTDSRPVKIAKVAGGTFLTVAPLLSLIH